MEIRITTKIISKLKPCQDRFDNWKLHYENFDGDIIEFLELKNISSSDKYWVAFRLMPRFLVEVFAIDCAFATANAADAANAAAYAANAAAYAAYAAAYAADANAAANAANAAADAAAYAADAAYAAADAAAAERKRQLEALKYLIETYNEKEEIK